MQKSLSFKPERNLISYYFIIISLAMLCVCYSWIVPLIIFVPESQPATIILLIIVIVIHIICFIWAYYYYKSLQYFITEEHVKSIGGVLIKQENTIPLTKINLVTISRNIFEKALGIASINFHSAAMGLAKPEISFKGLSPNTANEIREEVLKRIGILTEERRKHILEEILHELKEIRNILVAKLK